MLYWKQKPHFHETVKTEMFYKIFYCFKISLKLINIAIIFLIIEKYYVLCCFFHGL